METDGLNIGYGMCGSFCTIKKALEQMNVLAQMGMNIFPIMSFNTMQTDTRFQTAESIIKKAREISGRDVISRAF